MYYRGTGSLKTWVVKSYENWGKCPDKLRVYLHVNRIFISDVLRDLVPFVQFEKHEKHSWRRVFFSKVAGLSNTPPWVFFTFFKLYKWYQITQRITYTTFFRFLFHGEKLEYCENLGVLESHAESRSWKSVIRWSSVLAKCRGVLFIVKLEQFFYKNFPTFLKM